MTIDFHTHCFPDTLASRAMARLVPASGAREPYYDGSYTGMLACLDGFEVDEAVVLNIATNPKQQRSVNEFAVTCDRTPRLHGFGSVHPFAPNALDELDWIKAQGLKGIKLHPDYQGFSVDDPQVFPIYDKAMELGLIVVFHAGMDIGLPDPIRCAPRALASVLPRFAGGTVVAAHFGGYACWNDVLRYLCGKEVYLDTSYAARKMPPPFGRAIYEAHGASKLLFGSDLPWADPRDEAYFLTLLGAPQDEINAILGGNARRLLAC
ncbi:MAG: amidohydrolase [Oscillospiraceae bacterium]|jgi:predicted TIM-barrel fold metal-dependent hydrolase|nr:amidohydrolase [Oscillospiraceae bacterium]